MVGKYLQSTRLDKARTMLNGQMSVFQKMEVRDILATSILLANVKRSGDMSHLKITEVTNAKTDEEGNLDVLVSKPACILVYIYLIQCRYCKLF